MMRRRALVFGLLAAACGKEHRSPPPLVWHRDVDVDLAYGLARRTGRPVFLFFGATWDCASKELEHRTFPDPEVASLLFYEYVLVHVDCSDDERPLTNELTRRFAMKGTPTMIVTRAGGGASELWRACEYVAPDQLAIALGDALGRFRGAG